MSRSWWGVVVAALAMLLAPAAAAATSTSVRSSKATTTIAGTTITRTVTTTVTTTATATDTTQLITDKTHPPAGYRLTALQVLAIARRSPVVQRELRCHPTLEPYEYTKGAPQWQVSWFTRGGKLHPQKEMVQVYVDDDTGKVTQAWTGFQVAWSMARGYSGAFGRIVNAWYIWIPMCLLFVAPFFPWRRRPGLIHLDLVMLLLCFSVSLAFFNHADIGMSTPLFTLGLLYLFVRLLTFAFGRGRPREPLRTVVPVGWLAFGVLFLMGFRIALNVLDSNVIDVGFSGVIGADKLIHGVALYGHWPTNDAFGDTYGPFNYFMYVPFRWGLGWSGLWDNLPAAHGAAIFFDVGTLLALYALGRRWKGHALGVVLAYLWAADPFTLWTLSSNTNDALVALMVTLALLFLDSAPTRGGLAALAGLTKFAPFIITPLLGRGTTTRLRDRDLAWFVGVFWVIVVLCMLPVLLQNDLHWFWSDSIKYQSDRDTPFSIWGLWGGLSWLQHIGQGAIVALALLVCFRPVRRGPVEVAALCGALICGLQMVTNYWLYSYIVWFLPATFAALFGAFPEPGEQLDAAWRALEGRRIQVPPPTVDPAAG